MNNKLVTVLIPIYRQYLTPDEVISFNQCLKILNKYDIQIIAPIGLNLDKITFLDKSIQVERFSKNFFQGISGYNKLMLSKNFYMRFLSYKYILIYQLDALVFYDNLDEWCEKNYDYIGAPWFSDFEIGKSKILLRAGNGGLSLRKVETFVEILSSKNFFFDINKFNIIPIGFFNFKFFLILKIFKKFKKIIFFKYINLFLKFFDKNEDIFWSVYAQFFIEKFKIPKSKYALFFAFESQPRYCFKLINKNLPFGCHGWYRYDKNFWYNILKYKIK